MAEISSEYKWFETIAYLRAEADLHDGQSSLVHSFVDRGKGSCTETFVPNVQLLGVDFPVVASEVADILKPTWTYRTSSASSASGPGDDVC